MQRITIRSIFASLSKCVSQIGEHCLLSVCGMYQRRDYFNLCALTAHVLEPAHYTLHLFLFAVADEITEEFVVVSSQLVTELRES